MHNFCWPYYRTLITLKWMSQYTVLLRLSVALDEAPHFSIKFLNQSAAHILGKCNAYLQQLQIVKLRNRHTFHCKILGYIFLLYSTSLNSKLPLYCSFFFSNSRWSTVAIFRFFVLPVNPDGPCWHYKTKLSFSLTIYHRCQSIFCVSI